MAVTITAVDLRQCIGCDPAAGERLLAVATAHVERYAPDAPEEVQNEAVIRFSGYLNQSAVVPGALRSVSVGGLDLEAAPTHGPAFRNCGAAALLSPWKVRRAGAI